MLLLLALACGPGFHDVQKEGTIEAYEAFITEKPNDPSITLARISLEELYLEKARAEQTLAAYDIYLDRYRNDDFAKHMDEALAEREDFLYNQALADNTSALWESYLAEYPNGGGKEGKKRRQEANKRIQMNTWMDKVEVAPLEVERVNLAEDPDGPLNGWGFRSTVTNHTGQTITTLNMEIQYLDATGAIVEVDRWPLLAPRAPGNIPIEEEWKQPLQDGQSRDYWYMDSAPEAAGWSQKARLVPTAIVFEGGTEEE